MISASKYYDESNKDFKAPGQWVSLKSTKKFIDEDKKSRFYNKKSNEYFFSEELMSSYKEYSQSEVKQEEKQEVKTESKPEWFELVYEEAKDFFSDEDFRYIETKAFQTLLGISFQYLYKDLTINNPWDTSVKEVKESIGGFLAPVLVECKSYTRKFDKHYLDNVSGKYSEALSRHLVISRTKTLFETEDFKVVINHKNNIVKV